MRIAHSSDLHGRLIPIFEQSADFDLWLDTGDFCAEPDYLHYVSSEKVAAWQKEWFVENIAPLMIEYLAGRPFVTVAGNHDLIQIGELLREVGYENAHTVTLDGVEVAGKKFAGHSHIPMLYGVWANETEDASALSERAVLSGAEILATHAPPLGILDTSKRGRRAGFPCLSASLLHLPHSVKHHFFGHIHEGRGTAEVAGVKFYNGATRFAVHEV